MATDTKTADKDKPEDQEEELHVVEVGDDGQPLADDKAAPPEKDDKAKSAEKSEDGDEDDDEDEGDAKLAESQDDTDSDVVNSSKNRRRKKRKEMQRKARERTEAELAAQRERADALERRLLAMEGHALTTSEQTIDQQLRQALAEARQAEGILAKAIEAGNGEDAAAAIRIRDEAKERAFRLNMAKEGIGEQKKQLSNPGPDARVKSLAGEWLAANPWYDPNGRDEDSRITKAIDDGLVRDGYDPKTQEYWQELTARVSRRLSGGRKPAADDDGDEGDDGEKAATKPLKKPPPQSNGRGDGSPSGRNEVRVTPARKQAMMDAGIWDDPVRRAKQLRAYQQYDKDHA